MRAALRLRSLVSVGGGIWWSEGCVGDEEGDVKGRLGVRCDSSVAMRGVG